MKEFFASIVLCLVLALVLVPMSGPEEVFAQGSYDNIIDDFYQGSSWEDLDNDFTAAIAPWDWEVLDADYYIRVKEDFTAGQIVEFTKEGETIAFQPMALEWTNDLDQIQQISTPVDVTPSITNPEVSTMGLTKHEGTITWENAYGANIDFEWKSTPKELEKLLTVSALTDLPTPEQYIIDGGNPVLRLNLIFDPTAGLDIYTDGELWDGSTTVQTFEDIEFYSGTELLWWFSPLEYWDSGEETGQSVATLDKKGNSLYISIRVPYDWLQIATFPVYIDADTTVDANADGNYHQIANRAGVHWINDDSGGTGYIIYINSVSDLYWAKTTDGGENWGTDTMLDSGTIHALDTWADWQTEGDAGTKIHIAYIDSSGNSIYYAYLDTSDDSDDTDSVYFDFSGVSSQDSRSFNDVSIVKSRGGRIYITYLYTAPAGSPYYYGFEYSTDGTTWYEVDDSWCEDNDDRFLLFTGGETDDDDVWLLYFDDSANIITLKTYDATGDSWSESSSIKTSVDLTYAGHMGFGGAMRNSDNHLIACWWNDWDHVNADIDCYDITDGSTWSEMDDVVDDLEESHFVSVMIDQDSDDIYVVYGDGESISGTLMTEIDIRYKKSDDGGTTWSSAVDFADTHDDHRWVGAGSVKESGGGRWYPVWFNDDTGTIMGNYGKSVSIAEPSACSPSIALDQSTWAIGAVSEDETKNTGLDWCTITNNSGGSIDIYIQGTDMMGGTAWDLSDDASNGNMIYGMHAGLYGGSYNIVVKESTTNLLKDSLADSGTQDFGLQLYTPTVFTEGAAKSGTVSVTAVCE